jgi:hypothetical protein
MQKKANIPIDEHERLKQKGQTMQTKHDSPVSHLEMNYTKHDSIEGGRNSKRQPSQVAPVNF